MLLSGYRLEMSLPECNHFVATPNALVELAEDVGAVLPYLNAVLPGAVDTSMLRAGLGRAAAGGPGGVQARLQGLASRTVIGRVGAPEEIAQAIYFLADEGQSSFMTGQSMVVDGGATSRLSTE